MSIQKKIVRYGKRALGGAMLIAVTAGMVGCSSSGPTEIKPADLETKVAALLKTEWKPEVTCPDTLTVEEGASTACSFVRNDGEAKGVEFPLDVVIVSVGDDGEPRFDVEIGYPDQG